MDAAILLLKNLVNCFNKRFKHLVVVVFAKQQYSSVAYGAMANVTFAKLLCTFGWKKCPSATCILALHKLRIVSTNNIQDSTKKFTSHKFTSHPISFTK
jgi:hypothetical protein